MEKEYEFCLRCGRKLKNPEARYIGYGSICLKKAKNGGKSRLFQPLKKVEKSG